MLATLFLLLAALYSLLLFWAWLRWNKMQGSIQTPASQLPDSERLFLSVVVVVRNEEKNISRLLADLWGQGYPADSWELLLVDDHSQDGTLPLARQMARESPVPVRLLQMREEEGKKQGLRWAVRQAKGEAFVVTDGDCRVGPQWLESYARRFGQGSVFVSGPVSFTQEKSLFGKMQTIEFASLVGVGAVLLDAGQPGMCNAANMGFRRQAYLEAETSRSDYGIPSGDDEFLLQAIHRQHPGGLSFLKSRQAVVYTYAQPDWSSFFQQRKRWAGKWRYHRQPAPLLTALLVFAFHACWLVLLAGLAVQGRWEYFFAGAFVKFLAEYLFLFTVLHSFGKKMEWLPFVLLQLLHPVYVLFFGLTVNFGSFRWKGRTYNYAKK